MTRQGLVFHTRTSSAKVRTLDERIGSEEFYWIHSTFRGLSRINMDKWHRLPPCLCIMRALLIFEYIWKIHCVFFYFGASEKIIIKYKYRLPLLHWIDKWSFAIQILLWENKNKNSKYIRLSLTTFDLKSPVHRLDFDGIKFWFYLKENRENGLININGSGWLSI